MGTVAAGMVDPQVEVGNGREHMIRNDDRSTFGLEPIAWERWILVMVLSS